MCVCVTLCVPDWFTVSLCSFTASQCNLHTFPSKYFQRNTNKHNDFYLWVPQRITEHKHTRPLLLFTAFCLNIFPLICHLFICFLRSHFLNLMGDLVSGDETGWRFLLLHEGSEPSLELNLSEMHCEYASGKTSGCVSVLQMAERDEGSGSMQWNIVSACHCCLTACMVCLCLFIL